MSSPGEKATSNNDCLLFDGERVITQQSNGGVGRFGGGASGMGRNGAQQKSGVSLVHCICICSADAFIYLCQNIRKHFDVIFAIKN